MSEESLLIRELSGIPATAVLSALHALYALANSTVNSHRNASLRKWLVEEHMLGDMGMGHPAVDGIFPDERQYA